MTLKCMTVNCFCKCAFFLHPYSQIWDAAGSLLTVSHAATSGCKPGCQSDSNTHNDRPIKTAADDINIMTVHLTSGRQENIAGLRL